MIGYGFGFAHPPLTTFKVLIMFTLDQLLSASSMKSKIVDEADALPGRDDALKLDYQHAVLPTKFSLPAKDSGLTYCLLGMGCFWGAERAFWENAAVHSTAVGYAAGFTPNPSYEEVCSGQTGHTEVVLVIFDPKVFLFKDLVHDFFALHNPTQGMRQGNDRGTQYRSGIYLNDPTTLNEFEVTARTAMNDYAKLLEKQSLELSSELRTDVKFYYAEQYHQQYLAKNPGGYCNLQSIDKTHLPEPRSLG